MVAMTLCTELDPPDQEVDFTDKELGLNASSLKGSFIKLDSDTGMIDSAQRVVLIIGSDPNGVIEKPVTALFELYMLFSTIKILVQSIILAVKKPVDIEVDRLKVYLLYR